MNLPDEVRAELEYEIARNELDYADTYRGYKVGDLEGEREFDTIREGGCCGSFETKVRLKNGDVWVVGCNYGH